MVKKLFFRKFVCTLVSMSLVDAPVSAATPKAYDRGTDDDSRLALVIGNSAYLADPLDNPVNDANAVAKALDRLGFEVMLAKDLNTQELRRRVRLFLERAEHERGTALVYYAGHAVAPGGRNILLPIDINPKNIREVEDEGVHLSKMLNSLETSRKHTRILIFDACRDNPYGQAGDKLIRTLHRGRGGGGASSAEQDVSELTGGLAEVSAKGTIVAFSTAPGSVAEDGEGRTNSVFTAHLVDVLAIPDLPIGEVFRRVTERVSAETRGAQVPWVAGTLARPFVFHPGSAAVPVVMAATLQAPEPLSQSAGELRRTSVEAKLAAEMAKIKQFQRAERVGAEQVLAAHAEQERLARERAAIEQKLAELAGNQRKVEAAVIAKKAEEERLAARDAAERKAQEEEAQRAAEARAAHERAAATRAEQLARERREEEAARAREIAIAESRRLADLELARLAEVRRLDEARMRRESEERERLAQVTATREKARLDAEAEAARLTQLALDKAQADERERRATAALQKQREHEASERKRAEAARLALLAEMAQPAALVDGGASHRWLRRDERGDLLVRGVRLPADATVATPAIDVPAACRGFSGAWGRARWEGARSAEVWVESVDASCNAKVIYARGGDSVDGDTPRFTRVKAQIENGQLRLPLSGAVELILAFDREGGMNAVWQTGARRLSLTFQRISADPTANAEYVALEDQDNGAQSTRAIRSTNFGRLLPMEVPGARTLSTAQLWRMLAENKELRLVSAHEGGARPLIERSVWLPDLGKPMTYRAVNGIMVRIGAKELEDLRAALVDLTGGDKAKPIVVYDRSVEWGWFGYHGVLRLREMGYTNVFWYRGGTDAWHDAGLTLRKLS